MSSILKALKKLEDEKIARKPDSIKLDAEILHDNASPRFSLLGIALTAALLFVCGSAATYLYMKPGTVADVGPGKVVSPSIPVERIVSDDIAPAVGASQALKMPLPPSDTVPAPTAMVQAKTGRPSPAVKPSSGQIQISKELPARTAHQQAAGRQQPATPGNPPVISIERPAANAPPVLTVNGIAFQDGVDSVAMINGIPASKGSMIEGVRVEDIQRDRVLFGYNGRNFEISLGKSNR